MRGGVAQRLRQTQASFEEAFAEQAEEDRQRAEELRRRALQRTAARRRERRHKRGSMRFGLLVLILLGTAVLVTVAMFQALYLVMG
jgi:hypothetical protein